MYTYLAPNGGNTKDAFQCIETFDRRWKTVLRVADQLPKGDIEPPTTALQLKWFYHSFCKMHHPRWHAAGHNWNNETFETLSKYFSAQHHKDLDSGILSKIAYRTKKVA